MSTKDLATGLRDAQLKVTSGKNMNQDGWMTRWCGSNWGDLLQPAPMTIVILANLRLISESVSDFDLRVDSKGTNGVDYQWQYVKMPDSFRASLIQMTTSGDVAFEHAYSDMSVIQMNAEKVPTIVVNLVNMLLHASTAYISQNFSYELKKLLDIAVSCSDAGKRCQADFTELQGLAHELATASQRKRGATEANINTNAISLEVLKVQKDQQQQILEASKTTLKSCSTDFQKAQDMFKQASDDVPGPWSIVGMNIAESAMNMAVTAGNAYLSMATMPKQLLAKDLGAVLGGPAAAPKSSTNVQPDNDASQPPSSQSTVNITPDPGLGQAALTLTYARLAEHLLKGNDGKPLWDMINKDDGKSGPKFVQASLQDQTKRLDESKEQPFSSELLSYVKKLTEITEILVKAETAETPDTVLLAKLPDLEDAIQHLQALQLKASHATQSTGNIAAPLFTSKVQASDGKASTAAVAMAKDKLTQCRSNLESARSSYEHVSDQVVKQQTDLTKMLGDMAHLDLVNQGLKEIVPILIKAVGAFTTLSANISMMVQFFDSIAGLITEVMQPSVNDLTRSFEQGSNAKIGGLDLEHFARNMMHQQALMVSQVSLLCAKIAGTYCEVHNQFIAPTRMAVEQILSRIHDDQGKLIPAKVQEAQSLLSTEGAKSQNGIIDLVKKDQQTFMQSISDRLDTLDKETSELMEPELPKLLQDTNTQFVNKLVDDRKAAAKNDPTLKTNEAIHEDLAVAADADAI